MVTMIFSAKLAAFLSELRKMYAKLYLKDIGKLQSKYSIRILELAVSFASMSGKEGNNNETWYCEYSIPDWRLLLAIPEDAYQETKRLRQKVIENPVKEINNAGIGLEITTEGIKQGRKLKAVRLICKKTARTTAPRRGKNKGTPPLELPEASSKTEDWREEKELHHLKELHPEEFAALYAEALAKTPAFMADMAFGKITAEAVALIRLKEKYGIVT
jgi:plasmid replication initiation protein